MENSMKIERQLFFLHYFALACNNAERTKVCYTRYQWNNSKIEPNNSGNYTGYNKCESYQYTKYTAKFSYLLYFLC